MTRGCVFVPVTALDHVGAIDWMLLYSVLQKTNFPGFLPMIFDLVMASGELVY